MNALKDIRITGLVWLMARLWLGYEWFIHGIEKVFGPGSEKWVGSEAGVAVTGFLNGAIAKSPLAPDFNPVTNPHPAVQEWYARLAQDYFLPNAALFSYMVAYGELLVGLALLLGIFTHFSALMGVMMNAAFLFAGTTSTNPNMLIVGMVILLAGGAAVGFYGLDYFLRPIERKLTSRTRARLFPAPQAS